MVKDTRMEIVILVLAFVVLDIAAQLYGTDSRPRGAEPGRS